ncbi:unnamed protein product [Auanema sp. JU1783]|nr:unnamed protein product [Auanema sp. JU1783]
MISVRDRFQSFEQIHQMYSPKDVQADPMPHSEMQHASSTSNLALETVDEEEMCATDGEWIELTDSDIQYLRMANRPELEKFLGQVTGIREDLRNLRSITSKIRKFHEKLRHIIMLRGAERDFVRMIIRELDREVEKFQSSSQKICQIVNNMNDRFKQENRQEMSQAEFRIRRDQILCIVEGLKTVINHFNYEQIQYETENRQKAARLIKSQSLEAQYSNRIEKEGLLPFIADQNNLPAVLDEIKDRHVACLRLEASTDELSQMFHELKIQLEVANPMLDDIQCNVEQCEEYTERSIANIHKIRKKIETKRKLERGMTGIALLIIIGLIGALLLNFSGVILLLILK